MDDRLQEIGERLARVEERLQDLPVIRASLAKLNDDHQKLRTKEATNSSLIAVIVSAFVSWVSSFWGGQ